MDALLYLIILFLSMIPALESRFALPLAIGMGLSPEEALLIVLFGNSLAVPMAISVVSILDQMLLSTKGGMLKPISDLYRKISFRAARKVGGNLERLGYLGLLAFVAIPLPGSGVWTGALAAQVLRLKRRKTALALFGGQILAALLIFAAIKGLYSLCNHITVQLRNIIFLNPCAYLV